MRGRFSEEVGTPEIEVSPHVPPHHLSRDSLRLLSPPAAPGSTPALLLPICVSSPTLGSILLALGRSLVIPHLQQCHTSDRTPQHSSQPFQLLLCSALLPGPHPALCLLESHHLLANQGFCCSHSSVSDLQPESLALALTYTWSRLVTQGVSLWEPVRVMGRARPARSQHWPETPAHRPPGNVPEREPTRTSAQLTRPLKLRKAQERKYQKLFQEGPGAPCRAKWP